MSGWRRVKPWIGWIATLLVVAWGVQLFLLPVVVRYGLNNALDGLGLEGTTFHIARVSLWGAEVTKISTGNDEAAAIASVAVRYHLPKILTGKLDVLDVVGGQIRLQYADGKLDIGQLAHLTGSGTSTPSTDLPFDRLELLSCSLLLQLDTEKIYMPVSGTLQNKGAGRLEFNIKTNAKGADMRLTGIVGGTEAPTMNVYAAAVSAADVSRLLRRAGLLPEDFPIRVVGPFDVALSRDAAGWHADLQSTNLFVGGRVGATPIAVEKMEGKVSATLDNALAVQAVTGSFSAGRFAYGTTVTTDLKSSAEFSGKTVRLDISADSIATSSASAAGVTVRSAWTFSRPDAGSLRVSLEPASLVTVQDVSTPTLKLNKTSAAVPLLSIVPGENPLQIDVANIGATPTAVLNKASLRWSLAPLNAVANILSLQTTPAAGAMELQAAFDSQGLTADATLSIDGFDLSTPQAKLSRLHGATKVCINGASPKAGTMTCDAVEIAGQKLSGFTIESLLNNGKLGAKLLWPAIDGLTVRADADVDFSQPAPLGVVSVELAKTTISDDFKLQTAFAALDGVGITGTFGASAKLRLDEHGMRGPTAKLLIENAKVTSTEYDLDVDGIYADVTLDSLAPPTTPGGQKIRVRSGRVGKLNVVDGSVDFRLEGPRSIFVEKTSWGFAGGHLSTHAVRFDPLGHALEFVVWGEELSVDHLLKISTDGKSTGQGTLYGMLPVKVNWPALSFGEGYLYGAPGKGVLTMGETASIVTPMLDAQAGDSGLTAGVKQRTVAALRDFQYDLFRADLKQQDQRGLVATVHIEGRGRTGDRPQALDLTVNVTGLDQALQNVLVVKKLLSGSK